MQATQTKYTRGREGQRGIGLRQYMLASGYRSLEQETYLRMMCDVHHSNSSNKTQNVGNQAHVKVDFGHRTLEVQASMYIESNEQCQKDA
jgi:hypothetical protein